MKSEATVASDGTVVPLTWFDAGKPSCVMVFLPALGIQSKLYSKMGTELASRGCSVCLMEQRGHGASAVPIRRGTDFGIAEFVEKDIPAILDAVEARLPGTPVILGGHSLGGHLSTLYSGIRPQRISGLFHVACGFPYYRDFPASRALQIRLLCAMIPVFGVFPGYFPGKFIGFGGRESIRLMRDWRGWALTGSFDFGGRKDVEKAVAEFTGPVLALSLGHDDFSSVAAEERALSPLARAQVTQITLDEAQQGDYLGHFAWTREPAGVVNCLADWVERKVTS